tara:strand:+ start:2205 stop:3263 length:1059 start_codon:yes stop_codon:yes gene_type:complete
MRFIGNKQNLVEKIHNVLNKDKIQGNSIFDLFAGSVSVGKYFKNLKFQIQSSDIMYFSYVLQKAYIENNSEPKFEKLLNHIKTEKDKLFITALELVTRHLNNLEGVKGFIYKNYTPEGSKELTIPRMYFSNENGKKIDAIRIQIQNWYENNMISENEYFILIACLIETVPFYANISGVYAAFHKKWDRRATKPILLRTIPLYFNNYKNRVYNENSINLLSKIEADIFYLDPPYNERQYAPNYHILETIAKYDNPKIKGVTGIRNYDDQKSKFCNAKTAIKELENIAKNGTYKSLIMSYNSEGIMQKKEIIDVLSKYGKAKLVEFDYLRFKSNSNGDSKHKKYVKEQLYILKK